MKRSYKKSFYTSAVIVAFFAISICVYEHGYDQMELVICFFANALGIISVLSCFGCLERLDQVDVEYFAKKPIAISICFGICDFVFLIYMLLHGWLVTSIVWTAGSLLQYALIISVRKSYQRRIENTQVAEEHPDLEKK